MAAACGMTVIKRFTYRGDSGEEYANTYWFTGGPPADSSAFLALWTALTAAEKTVYPSTVKIVAGYGYNDDTGHYGKDPPPPAPSVWTIDLRASGSISGTLALTGGQPAPGDSAVWVRWKTGRLNSKGKAVFLRKYFHPALFDNATSADNVQPAQKTALDAFGTKLMDGSLSGTRTLTAAGHTDSLLSRASSPFVTTRTLKRRGKRPGS